MICILLFLLELSHATSDWRSAIYCRPVNNETLYQNETIHSYYRLHVCHKNSKKVYSPYNSTHIKIITYNDSNCRSTNSSRFYRINYFDENDIQLEEKKSYYKVSWYNGNKCQGGPIRFFLYMNTHCNTIQDEFNKLDVIYTDYSKTNMYFSKNGEETAIEYCNNEVSQVINMYNIMLNKCIIVDGEDGNVGESVYLEVNHSNFPDELICDSTPYITMMIVLFLCVLIF